jgi:hypothetical protein
VLLSSRWSTNWPRAIGGLFSDGVPIFAFNAVYDFTVLARELRRCEMPDLAPYPVLDPLVFNKKVDKYHKGKRTLSNLTQEYGVELENAHTSAADCLATERLAGAMTRKYPQLDMPAGELHDLQIGWAKEQAADLQAYFDRIGKTSKVNGDWPVQPTQSVPSAASPTTPRRGPPPEVRRRCGPSRRRRERPRGTRPRRARAPCTPPNPASNGRTRCSGRTRTP